MAKGPKVLKLLLHDKGFQETMKDEKIRKIVSDKVLEIQTYAGPGHKVDVQEGRTRIRGTVTTDTIAAKRREAKNRNLTNAAMRAKR